MAPPHNNTSRDRLRSFQDSAFLPLLWWLRTVTWRPQYRYKCQLSMAPLTITLASHYLGESHMVLGQTQPSQGKSDSNDWWAGPCPVLILSHYSPSDLYSLKVTSTLLHAQMTNGKCCPLQFYKTASFLWDRNENLIDHCVELLQLAFYHSECTGHGQDISKPRTVLITPHTQSKHTIFTSQMLLPWVTYWDSCLQKS